MKGKITVTFCDKCGKTGAETVELSQNGRKIEVDLCHKCTLKLFAIYFKIVPSEYHNYLMEKATKAKEREGNERKTN